MRRSTRVLLVLMGGGVVATAAVPMMRTPDCDPAAQAQGACPTDGTGSSRSGSSSGHFGSSGSSGTLDAGGVVAGAAAGAAAASIARGGFGSTGSAHASSSSG